MITNNHIIDEDILKESNSINVTLNDDQKIIDIIIDNNRQIYTNPKYDITIIEMESIETIKYIELDMNIFNENPNIYNENIYILQYPGYGEQQKCAVSYGILQEVKDKYNLIHLCSTKYGSSGSPILNILNHKVIGIHRGSSKENNYNIGTLLKFPLNEYLKNDNFIKKEKLNNEIKDDINEIINKKENYYKEKFHLYRGE